MQKGKGVIVNEKKVKIRRKKRRRVEGGTAAREKCALLRLKSSVIFEEL